ncbi:family 43 glycosylhydrolase [Bifidobacterium sp. SMB2]|uniref:Family 43 glycosylhydrolase n=2 Tax=Bifidobacterium TaxID=1678 RepID=A0ABX0C8A8_9BIFI|nr:carbohydrate binding domain-containing protein [Bifidobacterium sp. SMB2]NEG95301.1 family 43 glycosylhydrolase [Bifidobacterium sp. SMB2]NEH11378.1 family 43 glycosylhydrolase [Bifidobacterium saimiriisciurei]
MKEFHTIRRLSGLLAGAIAVGMSVTAFVMPATAAETSTVNRGYTTSDNGDGTYSIPVLNSDVPDVSVMRLPKNDPKNTEGRDIYYMVSTTMELSPGAPVMKSYDLINWQIVTYVYDRISMSDASSLRNGASSYGEGEWAPSIRYHNGKFYVLFNTNNLGGAFIYYTDDIEHGTWTKVALGRGFHDPSLYFDENDDPWIISGANEYKLDKNDMKTVVESHENIISAQQFEDALGEVPTGFEGSQIFKIGKYFYNPTIYWGKDGRTVMLLRTTDLLDGSKYEARKYTLGGFAQGSLVEVSDKEGGGTHWEGFFFRDTYPNGRIPGLIPATWDKDGWPTFGKDNKVSAGDTYDKPISLPSDLENLVRLKSIVNSDDFDNDAPHQTYQDQDWWTLDEAPASGETEVISNGEVKDESGWEGREGAKISLDSTNHSAPNSLQVTGRTATGAGPVQSVSGKIVAGGTYTVSAYVLYKDGPNTKTFNFTIRDKNKAYVMASATAKRGEWSQISGSYTVPKDFDADSAEVFFETPWTATPDKTNDLMNFFVDDVSMRTDGTKEYAVADEYKPNGSNLDMVWEWAHNPDNRYWSLTDRNGWLRLTNGHKVSKNAKYMKGTKGDLTYFETARNMLSQRTFGGDMSAETKMDVSHMKDGDTAGIATYTRSFSYAAVRQENGKRVLGVVKRIYDNGRKDSSGNIIDDTIDRDKTEAFVDGSTVDLGSNTNVWLKSDNVLDNSSGRLTVQYLYSLDGKIWQKLGGEQGPFGYDWSLSHFKGYRIGLFNYAKDTIGGYVDFDYYDLSDVLSADGKNVSTAALENTIAKAKKLKPTEYPADEWSVMQMLLTKAETALANKPSTQNEVDAPQRALEVQLAQLAVDRTTSSVVPVSGVMVSLDRSFVKVGEVVRAKVSVKPENASDKSVSWSSSDEKVAKVDASGRVTAVGVGTVTITATAKDGSGVSGSAKLTVSASSENPGGHPSDNPSEKPSAVPSDKPSASTSSGSHRQTGTADGKSANMQRRSTLSRTGIAVGGLVLAAALLAGTAGVMRLLARRRQ